MNRLPFLARSLMVFACSPLAVAQVSEPTLDRILAALQDDAYPARHEARMELQDIVSTAAAPGRENERRAVEAQLLDRLQEDHPLTTRLWLLRQVESIGADASVEPLAALLEADDLRIADAARMALEANPSSRASDALLAALREADAGPLTIPLIQSLALRANGNAVSAITPYLDSEEPRLAEAAVQALGSLGGDAARHALQTAYQESPPERRASFEQSLLRQELDPPLLRQIAQQGANAAVRSAAFAQLASRQPREAVKLLEQAMVEGPSHASWLRAALESDGRGLRRTALKGLVDTDPATQAVVLGALPNGAQPRLERRVLELATEAEEPLKIQALNALARIGSARSLPLLMEALDARSRQLRESAAQALASIRDPKLDRKLLSMAQSSDTAARVLALEALGHRASPGASELVNRTASNEDEDPAARRAALKAMELIGTVESLPILVDLIVAPEAQLRREAQLTLKRLTLRTADPDAAWQAFKEGFSRTSRNSPERLALMRVLDAAPSREAVAYLTLAWREGDAATREIALRVLPSWRNWDAGFALLDLAAHEAPDERRQDFFGGVGRLILGSDASYSFERKFELADAALRQARSPQERKAIIDGFRYSTWRERVHVTYNEVDPELKAAVFAFAQN